MATDSEIAMAIQEVLLNQSDHERQADEAIRVDPDLRIEIVKIITEIAPIVKKHALEVARSHGKGGLFEADEVADLLTFKLAEFFVRGVLEHTNTFEPQILRGWQLTPDHAADWESVQINQDGTFTTLEMYS